MILNKFLFFLCFVLCCDGDQFDEECGLEEVGAVPLVRRGLKVQPYQFPWHVALFHKQGGRFNQICGGSLVRMQLVITAAHCFSEKSNNHQVNVKDYQVVGGIRNSSWTAEGVGRQVSEVLEVRLGERYGGRYRNFQDDIAVVLLKTTFTFSDMVRPVCLDLEDRALDDRQTSPDSVGKVAGWGLTDSGAPSETLNYLSIPVVGDSECTLTFGWKYMRFITRDKLCAGVNGSAVCQGDSGGGLVFPLQATSTSPLSWYLRGVVSNSEPIDTLDNPCLNNTLALYTSIFKQRFWLSKNIKKLLAQEADCRVRGSVGVCRDFSACPGAIEEASRGITPQRCSPSSPEVCCVDPCPPLPPSTVTVRKTGSKANDYCVGLAEQIYPCQKNGSVWRRGDLCGPEPDKPLLGYSLARLVKASPTDVQRYTLMTVRIFDTRVHLVSERWLLGQASELDDNMQRTNNFHGDRRYDSSSTPEFTFSRIVYHPLYHPWNHYIFNIVLMEMDRPVAFSRILRPVCLPPPLDPVGGITVSALGGPSNHWPATTLPLEECGRVFPPGGRRAPNGVMAQHLCATFEPTLHCEDITLSYITASNRHRVACTRQLLGLWLNNNDANHTCTALYLRVAHFVPWVESVVWP